MFFFDVPNVAERMPLSGYESGILLLPHGLFLEFEADAFAFLFNFVAYT